MKKIIYSNSDDYRASLEAVNERLIDGFISKSTSTEVLIKSIKEIVFDYFEEQTKSLKNYLEIETPLPLSDKLFNNYFKTILENKKIIQYNIMDKNGNIMFEDVSGNKYILIIHTEDSLQEFLKFIKLEKEFNEIYKQVENREKIPYVNNQHSLNFDIEKLELFDPNILIGEKKYYIYCKQYI